MTALAPAPARPDEAGRLAALRRYDVLDTPPEPAFDRITRTAARLFGVPTALVSLVDADRQWFKSCVGLDARQTDRAVAFCDHAIRAPGVLVVPDARADDRFAANPLVVGPPHIRFYAGAPLRTPDGHHLGTLCVIDAAPREFGPADRASLADLAALVVDQLGLRAVAAARERAEAAARHAEERARALLEHTADAVSVLGPDGGIVYESPSAGRVFGSPPGERIGTDGLAPIHPADRPRIEAAFRGLWVTPGPGPLVEYRYRQPDGGWRHLQSIGEDRTADPAVGGVVVSTRDVTARKRDEERLRLLESAVVHANDAVLITDAEPVDGPDGPRIRYVNEAFTRMTGYAAEDVIGKTPRLLQGPGTAREPRDTIRRALKRWRPVVVELLNYRKDGSEFWVEVSIVPVADANGWYTHWVSVQRDIGPRKKVEADLQAAKDAAEAADRAKSEFLSRMSHELRTPLNGILGFSQILQMEPLAPAHRAIVDDVYVAGRRLLALINEVLDISRVEAGALPLSIEPVPLHEVARESLALIAPLAARRHLQVANELDDRSPAYVLADRQRLGQVFLNLLSNAVKYNADGGRLTVAAEATPDGRVRVRVTDTGPGIPAELMGRLFTPFDRLGAERNGVEGTGLGLALSKRLVEVMGGSMEADSQAGRGSTFGFVLPAAAPPPAALSAADLPGPADPPAGHHTVLYVEDNLANYRVIELALAHRPRVKLLAALHGGLGLELAAQHRPDLILLDLHLPDMPGREVLRRLKDDPATRDIPVVVLSADATTSQIARLRLAGVREYLTKPLDVRHFFRVLDDALRAAGPAGGA